ncbi:MAG: DNA methyltransferase [Verrucomicrobiota bacterium]
MTALQTDIHHGDCLEVLKRFPDEHFDLVFTSPPYADRRKNTYGGTKPEHYVKWFLPRAAEFQRVLKRSGSFQFWPSSPEASKSFQFWPSSPEASKSLIISKKGFSMHITRFRIENFRSIISLACVPFVCFSSI